MKNLPLIFALLLSLASLNATCSRNKTTTDSSETQASKWDSLPPTNTDEAKVRDYTLPDPLIMANGKPVQNVNQWEQIRRPEVLELCRTYMYGRKPDQEITVAYKVIEEDVVGMNGLSRRTQIRIHFPERPGVHPIRMILNTPAESSEPVPTLLHLSFTPNVLLYEEDGIDEGTAWSHKPQTYVPDREAMVLRDINPRYFVERGFGIATVYYGDIEPDADHGGKYGVRTLFDTGSARQADSWGNMGGWAWGLSRVMDYLQTNQQVASEKIALSGFSRLGKAILWAAAQDQRFAMAIPMASGEGGAAISRRNYGETIADLTNPRRFDYWFAPRYADYAFAVDDLPLDGHFLLALIAPRPLLQIVGVSDTWSDPKGEWIAAQAAAPVYELYGLETVQGEPNPKPGDRILRNMGFFLHDAGHTVLPVDFEVMTNFMKMHFGEW